VRMTVLGKSPAWQDVDGACSGYLVQEGEASLLLDIGNGVFGKLRRFLDYVDLDAIVVSHLHADHFLDLVPYAHALVYAPRQQPVPVDRWPGTDAPARPALYAPRGATETFRKLSGLWGSEDLIERAFAISEYSPDDVLSVGPFTVRFAAVPHYLPTCAIDVAVPRPGGGSARLTYGADCRPNEDLVDFARGTDLLLVEATLRRPELEVRGHLTPGEAGEHGRRAHAGRLVLTHMSDELDATWATTEAQASFGQPVTMAAEGAVYTV
jgi:ribonuclease BN (tRNA processing enzyme)